MPSSIVSRPAIIFNKVDFPHPDGPKSTKKFPSSISRLIFFKTSVLPNFLKDLVFLMLSFYPFTAPEVSPFIKYLPANT